VFGLKTKHSEVVLLQVHDVSEFSLVVGGHVVEVLLLFGLAELSLASRSLSFKELVDGGLEAHGVLAVELDKRSGLRVGVH
jgi:hypothetical protein